MTFRHSEIYLVARVEKILQAGITACAEPYMKTGDNTKVGGNREGRGERKEELGGGERETRRING